MLVDLHIHTYYSDGTMSPKEVVEDAKRKNLGIIAITDHDVLDSYEELKVEAEKAGIIAISRSGWGNSNNNFPIFLLLSGEKSSKA